MTGGDINFTGIDLHTGCQAVDCDDSGRMCTSPLPRTSMQDNFLVKELQRLTAGRPAGAQPAGRHVASIDDTYEGPMAQEIVLDFTPTGRISDFNLRWRDTRYLAPARWRTHG